MSVYQPSPPISINPMLQLVEARDKEDDWTGLTDAAARRKRQTRLNTRAYRRRKALEAQAQANPASETSTTTEAKIPCWVEDQQSISIFPASIAQKFTNLTTPLLLSTSPNIPQSNRPKNERLVFPLSSDHLIVLLQYNVLRGSIINRQLLTNYLQTAPQPNSDCSSPSIKTLPPPTLPTSNSIPPSLLPTHLQSTIPHESWVDIIPHPKWRDNVLLLIGTFDEDELWSDTIGGLFEGFPQSEVEVRGIIFWGPSWDISGWEISEGFWRKWGWSLRGCEDILEVTNGWRRRRGEEPLVFEI